jgi:hypothetical protein
MFSPLMEENKNQNPVNFRRSYTGQESRHAWIAVTSEATLVKTSVSVEQNIVGQIL